jgi:hypothetical protein
MAWLRRAIIFISERTPSNLAVFVAAIFLANGVGTFTAVYGTDNPPAIKPALLISCAASLLAAALWTLFASKVDRIERTAAAADVEPGQRDAAAERLWGYVWVRVSLYLGCAILSSVVALVILVVWHRPPAG